MHLKIKERAKRVNILFCLKPNEKFKQNHFCIISKNVKLAFIGDIYETLIIFIQYYWNQTKANEFRKLAIR